MVTLIVDRKNTSLNFLKNEKRNDLLSLIQLMRIQQIFHIITRLKFVVMMKNDIVLKDLDCMMKCWIRYLIEMTKILFLDTFIEFLIFQMILFKEQKKNMMR